jgi:hypothetical protein
MRMLLMLAVFGAALSPGAAVTALIATAPTAIGAGTEDDLDAFMARVLARRDEAWRRLHDYVLSEREAFQILGPNDSPLHGERREYTWYVRDGLLVRSPLRFNGVTLSDAERRKYEENWLGREREREQQAAERAAREADDRAEGDPSLEEFVDRRGEPRFISEAYFLRFKFEPGNYYLVGRESLDGRQVLRIEYYPSRLFGDDDEREAGRGRPEGKARGGRQGRERGRDVEGDLERDIDRKMNKASLVTLWVDPAEHQIVRYTFDNMDFGFLPGRWLVRVDGASASMTMARVLDDVWLPARISMSAAASLASGGYRFEYGREFFDYRKAEVGARIRGYVPRRP